MQINDDTPLHFVCTQFSAHLSTLIVEMIDRHDPTIFAEIEGENLCVRLQEEISTVAAEFFREIDT